MKKYKYQLAGAVVCLLLLLTNPSIKAFKDYVGSNTYLGLRRTSNFFVCSVYNDGDKYFAILGNFFKLNRAISSDEQAKTTIDSSKMADSSKMKMADSKVSSYDTVAYPVNKDPLHILPKYKYFKLYNNLIKNGVTTSELGTFDEFYQRTKLKSYDLKLYDNLIQLGFTEKNLGTKDEFVKALIK